MKTLCAVAAAILACACDIQVGDKGVQFEIAHGKASDEWVRTYPLAPGGRLEIENVNGPIEVLPAAGKDVEVRAAREANFHSEEAARAALERLEMREEVAAGRVRVEAIRMPGEGGLSSVFEHGRLRLEYTVRVPPGLTVSVKTRNGTIRVEDVQALIEAATSNGSITVTGLSGGLDASVVNGPMRVDVAELKQGLKISSTNGPVRLDLPRDVKADVEATWVNGRVEIDDAFGAAGGNSDEHQLTAKLNGGGPKISLNTVNGGVRVRPRESRTPE